VDFVCKPRTGEQAVKQRTAELSGADFIAKNFRIAQKGVDFISSKKRLVEQGAVAEERR